MSAITLENYISLFENQDNIRLESNAVLYHIEKENNEPILFFSDHEAVIKISDDQGFYALKCYINADNYSKNDIYGSKIIEKHKVDQNLFKEYSLEVADQAGTLQHAKVIVAPWIDDVAFLNCDTRYIKKMHDIGSNAVYKKLRRKVKGAVFSAVIIFLLSISSIKLMFPNEIYINPIDYKQLIAADSIRTVNLALNKTNSSRNNYNLASNEAKPGEKSVFIKESANEVFSILVPEPVKADKPPVVKVKETKVTVVAPVKKKVVLQKKKELNDQEIKVIHSKSKVTFKSTDF